MTFLDEPPPVIGEVQFSWTNNGPDGPSRVPLGVRLLPIAIGAMGGLVAFFVIAGVMEHRGAHVEPGWFLDALGAGAIAGILLALPSALRAAKVLTLYVGRDGCVEISAGKPHFLDFREVESIRSHISTMTYRGIRTSARELHVRRKGKEKLWYVSSARPEPDDPGTAFADAVVEAFERRRKS